MYSDARGVIVRKVSRSAGRELVIPKGSVIFKDKMIDITERVINEIKNNPPVRLNPTVPSLDLA